MSYKALYRIYRPALFEDVVGQDYIVKTLKNAIDQNKIAHAYLFSGPRGTGKTSVAKLLAKAINCTGSGKIPCMQCENCIAANQNVHPDIIELDAASNNGVEEIREIIEKVKYAPIQGKYKVYIIDEVHMLSNSAFNALLKTLEEPPAHVIFILATTDPQKVLPTIISRCQRYHFNKVDVSDISSSLMKILKKEGIAYDLVALELIADLADGGMRDALSILDQCIAYNPSEIKEEFVNSVYGILTTQEKIHLLKEIRSSKVKALIEKIKAMEDTGIDIKRLTNDLLNILKETMIYAYEQDENLLKKINQHHAKSLLETFSIDDLLQYIEVLQETSQKYKTAFHPGSYFEIAILKLCGFSKKKQDTKAKEPTKKEKQVKKINEEILLEDKEEVMDDEPEHPEEERNIEPTPQQEVQQDINEPLEDTFLLGLLTYAQKEYRQKEEVLWKKIQEYRLDLNYGKSANLLMDVKIVASGEDYLLVESTMGAIVKTINEHEINVELYQFLKEVLELDKMIYAIDTKRKEALIESFMKHRKQDTLPMCPKITKHECKVCLSKEEKELQELQDIFQDTLEIKGE